MLGALSGNEALIVCDAIFKRERPLAYVGNDEDGSQAICDLNHREAGDGCNAHVVCLSWLFENHPEAEELKRLEMGASASRTNGAWHVHD